MYQECVECGESGGGGPEGLDCEVEDAVIH